MTWIIGINVKRNSSRSFHGEISTYVEIRAYNYLNNKEYVEYVDEYPGMIDIIKKRTIEDRIILKIRKIQAQIKDDTRYGLLWKATYKELETAVNNVKAQLGDELNDFR